MFKTIFVTALTFLFLAFSSTPLVFAQESEEEIQAQIQNLQEQIQVLEGRLNKLLAKKSQKRKENRQLELAEYLKLFPTKNLRLGEPAVRMRHICEQFGVYVSDRHIRDIYSSDYAGATEFSKYTFLDAVEVALRLKGMLSNNFVLWVPENGFKITLDTKATVIFQKWGVSLEKGFLSFGPGAEEAIQFDEMTKVVIFEGDEITYGSGPGTEVLRITNEDKNGKIEKAIVVSKKIISVK